MALTDSVTLILTAADRSGPAFVSMIRNTKLLQDELIKTNAIMGNLATSAGMLATRIDTAMTLSGDATRAYGRSAVYAAGQVDLLAASIGRLSALQRTSGVLSGGSSIGAGPFSRAAGQTAARDVSALGGIRGVGAVGRLSGVGGGGLSGLAEAGGAFGVGGGAGLAALAGVAITLGAAALAMKDAAAFTTAEAQVAANTGVPLTSVQNAGQAALNLAASGKSPINATASVQGLLYAYSAQIAPSVIKQALPLFAQQAGIQGLATTDLAVNADTDLQAAFGGGGKAATLKSLTYFADMLQKSEQVGKVPPGAIAGIVSKFAPAALLSKETLPDALAAISKMTDTGASAQLASTYLTSLNTSLFLKPTATTQKIAANYGIELGQNAQKDAGGLFPYLQEIKDRIPTALLGQFLSNARSIKGYGLLDTAQGNQSGFAFSEQLSKGNLASGGTTAKQFGVSQQGVMQQLADTSARFHADMTTVGTYLLKDFLPPLLTGAGLFLSFAEAMPGMASKAGGLLDAVTKALHITKGDLLTVGAGPFAPILWAIQHPTQIRAGLDAAGNAWNALPPAEYFGHHVGMAGTNTTQGLAGDPAPRDNSPLARARRIALLAAPSAGYTGTPATGHFFTPPTRAEITSAVAQAILTGTVSPSGGASAAMYRSSLPGGVPSAGAIAGAVIWTPAMEAAANARYADINKHVSLTRVQDDATRLSTLIASGTASPAQLAKSLGVLRTAAYAPPGSALAAETDTAKLAKMVQAAGKAVTTEDQRQAVAAATAQLNASQVFADSVRIHHGSVQQQITAAQGIYHASVNLTGVGKLTGLAKQDALNRALDTLNTSIVTLTGQYITQAQQGVSLAQAQHDPVAEQRALTGEIQTYTKNANVLFGPNGTATTGFKLATLPLITQRAQAGLTPLQESLQAAQGGKSPAAIQTAVRAELGYYAANRTALFGADAGAYQLATNPLTQTAAQAGQQPLTEQLALAQAKQNPAMIALAAKNLIGYDTAHMTDLGLNATTLQTTIIGLKNLFARVLPGPQLIRPTVAGLGLPPVAGFGASTARLAGGSADAQSRLIAAMQAQITALQQALRIADAQLAAQNKGNSTADKIERNTRPHAATPNPARGHALDHIRLAV